MMNNKKAQFFVGFVVILAFFALLGALIVLSSKYKVTDAFGVKRIIGEKQATLFNLYQRGETARFFVEQASEVAALNAINNLSREKIGCDVYMGYSVWSTKVKKCIPNAKIASEKFKQEFVNKLRDLSVKYTDVTLNPNNYELTLSKNLTILGKSITETGISSGLASTVQTIPSYSSEIMWPVNDVVVTSCYGLRDITNKNGDWHDGIDIRASEGQDILAVAEGTVVKLCDLWKDECACSTGTNSVCNTQCYSICGPGFGGYGNFVILKHSDGFYSRYDHLSKVGVVTGQKVAKGEIIGKAGNTGLSFGSHLDFKVYFSDNFASDIGKPSFVRNPACYLPAKPLTDYQGKSCQDGDGIGGCGDSPMSAASSAPVYSFNTDFNATINYSFDEYQQINESMQRISEKILINKCEFGKEYGGCVNKILADPSVVGDFKFTFQCGQKAPESKLLLVCAESKYTFMNVYGKKEPFLYKIAYFLGDTIVPKKVEGLTVVDKLKQEKNLTISFDLNSEPDMESYNIYYSSQDFTNIKEERTEENRIKFLKSVKHSSSKIETTVNVSEDKVQYHFAVTPLDTSGNENFEVTTVRQESIDDLYPGLLSQQISFDKRPIGVIPNIGILIISPTKNEDGSDLKDLKNYAIYLRDAGDATACFVTDVAVIVSNLNTKQTVQFDMTSSPNVGELELSDAKKNYCLVAIPVDKTEFVELTDKTFDVNNIVFVKFQN